MLLRKDDPWPDELSIPDIRNWRVLDQNGDEIGFVETLVVDRQDGAFEALLIGANDRFSRDEVEIDDGHVRVMRPLHRTAQVIEEDNDHLPDFATSYRHHYERTYDDERVSFDDLLNAYRFGREIASDADFAGRSFDSAAEDVKAHYRGAGLAPPFEIARDAVRWAYSLVHENRPFESGGMDRESMQTLGPSAESKEHARSAGAAMSNTRPGDE